MRNHLTWNCRSRGTRSKTASQATAQQKRSYYLHVHRARRAASARRSRMCRARRMACARAASPHSNRSWPQHVCKENDKPFEIARRYNVSLPVLMLLNIDRYPTLRAGGKNCICSWWARMNDDDGLYACQPTSTVRWQRRAATQEDEPLPPRVAARWLAAVHTPEAKHLEAACDCLPSY